MIPVFCPAGQGQLTIIGGASPVAGYTAWYNPTTIQHSGAVVTAWNDASANAFHFGTAVNSPVYTSSAINGLAGVTGNGSTSQRELTSTATLANVIGASSTAYTLYAVFTANNFTGSGVSRPGAVITDSAGFLGLGTGTVGDANYIGYSQGTGGTFGISSAASTTGITVIMEMYYDGTNLHLRFNGTDATPVGSTGGITTTGTLQVGKSWTSDWLDGSVCEIIIYNSVLSSGNRTAMHSYLGTKYAGTG